MPRAAALALALLHCSASAAAASAASKKPGGWLRGTVWNWNDWRHVTFECDGGFNAPTPECEAGDCTWEWNVQSAEVHIKWGQEGVHRLRPEGIDGGHELRGGELVGVRERDGDPCKATFVQRDECSLDLYEVLGVSRSATRREISKAYRKLSMRYHPDKRPKQGGKDAAARGEASAPEHDFTKLAEAYETLSDADKRSLYDTYGTATPTPEQRSRRSAKVRFYGEEDSLVSALSLASFLHLQRDGSGKAHVVDFYAPWCGHCQELTPHFRRVAISFADEVAEDQAARAQFYSVNCDAERALCQQQGVHSFPSVRIYIPHQGLEEVYDGDKTFEPMRDWINLLLRADLSHLGAANFEREVMRPPAAAAAAALPLDWLVDFSAGKWCGPCTSLQPAMRRAAATLSGRMRVGLVNCDRNKNFCSKMGVTS